jgi:hypothetical protein
MIGMGSLRADAYVETKRSVGGDQKKFIILFQVLRMETSMNLWVEGGYED